MDEILENTLLYDFYGELLTEHQRQLYEDVFFNDLSYTEAARELGISRQGVYDQIRRISKSLAEYEEKLHLVAKFMETRALAAQIKELAVHYEEAKDDRDIDGIKEAAQAILSLNSR